MADSRSRTSGDGSDVEAPPDDDPRDVLSDQRRRYALATVYGRGTAVSIPELARIVVDREVGPSAPGGPPERVRCARIELYHVHAPKLAAAGLARFDDDRNELAPPEDEAPIDPRVESLLPSP